MTLDVGRDTMLRAVDDVSEGGRFVFTRAQLGYELERAGAIPVIDDPARERPKLVEELCAWERAHGLLPGLVRPEALPEHADAAALPPDVLEYAVPRALVFADRELCMAFVLNGFHRKIEVAPVTIGYPSHVWDALLRQVRTGFETRFLLARDASARGYRLAGEVAAALPDGSREVADLGMTLSWAFRMRMRLRRGEPEPLPPGVPARDAALFEHGGYTELSALAAGPLLRWVYEMIGDQAEDAGFG
jgi:hypothetical protein